MIFLVQGLIWLAQEKDNITNAKTMSQIPLISKTGTPLFVASLQYQKCDSN